VSQYLAHLDALDYDAVELILDSVQVYHFGDGGKGRQLLERSSLLLHYRKTLKGRGIYLFEVLN